MYLYMEAGTWNFDNGPTGSHLAINERLPRVLVFPLFLEHYRNFENVRNLHSKEA